MIVWITYFLQHRFSTWLQSPSGVPDLSDKSMMNKIIILGCTGSIGRQTLDVINRYPESFELTGISAAGNRDAELLAIIRQYKPKIVVISESKNSSRIENECRILGITLLQGMDAQCELAAGKLVSADIVMVAISGTNGIRPTFAALSSGLAVALANKETLVAAGHLVQKLSKKTGAVIYPVDSEHSAIAQCISGIDQNEIHNLWLTCSGGPFHATPEIDLSKIKCADALAHPTWNMGTKITIDSATLMNKGLEMIEARWLFDVQPDSIKVIVHPESIVHSMVEMRDGSVMAQMSLPDMRLPILYALGRGCHIRSEFPRLNLIQIGSLHFREPDVNRFRCLSLAYDAIRIGGSLPTVMNAANEVAVDAFCKDRISFTSISQIIETVMLSHEPDEPESLEHVLHIEEKARVKALETISKWK